MSLTNWLSRASVLSRPSGHVPSGGPKCCLLIVAQTKLTF